MCCSRKYSYLTPWKGFHLRPSLIPQEFKLHTFPYIFWSIPNDPFLWWEYGYFLDLHNINLLSEVNHSKFNQVVLLWPAPFYYWYCLYQDI